VNPEALFLVEELPMILVVCAVSTVLLGHAAFQQWYVFRHRRRSRLAGPQGGPGRTGEARWPRVDVIVPCYNEDPGLLARCCVSIAEQDYPGRLRVWLIDDGSRNVAELDKIYRRYENRHRWTVVRQRHNYGKRVGQNAGFRLGKGEIVLTMDSDTVIARDGIRSIVAAFRDHRVGAVTGDVRALNAGDNWLTRIIDERYRLLFEHERAAQSWKQSVLCCSGPFSAYRRSVLRRVWKDYLGHTMWGRRCTFGDDLHLTLLVLAKGYQSRYEPRARARTQVPTTLRVFTRQQIRWNKSLYRELPLTLRVLGERGWFLRADVLVRLLLPLALGIALPWAAAQLALGGSLGGERLLPFVAAAILVQLVSVVVQTRDVRFLLLYGLVYVGLLIPIRVYALLTLGDNRWGTREITQRLRIRTASTTPSPVAAAGG